MNLGMNTLTFHRYALLPRLHVAYLLSPVLSNIDKMVAGFLSPKKTQMVLKTLEKEKRHLDD